MTSSLSRNFFQPLLTSSDEHLSFAQSIFFSSHI
nr:MAG TPA: hypothetical protein [Caudoviricetes sp.]